MVDPALQRKRVVHFVSLLTMVALLGDATCTLTRRPAVGLADNGDFWRVMHPAGIDHVEELGAEHHIWVRRTFKTTDPNFWSNPSSGAMVARVARAIGWGFRNRAGTVDIRQVGFLYLLLSMCVLGAALVLRVHPFLCLGFTWVLLDPGIYLFFNSFYSEPPALVAVAGVAVWFLGGNPFSTALSTRRRTLSALVIWALVVLGAFSRAPMMLFGVTVGMVLACWWARTHGRSRPRLLAAITVMVLVSPLAHFQWGPGVRFPVINNFNAVFRGIADFSARPERSLERLGIPRDYRYLVGGHFRDVTPELADHIVDLSRWRLVGLYLADPGATFAVLDRAAECLADGRRIRLGNFERSVAGPRRQRLPRQVNRAWQLDNIRGVVFAWPWLIWIFVAATAAWSLVRLARDRWRSNASPLILFLTLTVTSQVGAALLGDGTFALTRHLTVARLALDLLLVVAFAELVGLLPWVTETRAFHALRSLTTARGSRSRPTNPENH